MRPLLLMLFVVASVLVGCSKWNVEPKDYYSQAVTGTIDAKPYVLYDLDEGGVKGTENADFYWRVIDQSTLYLSPTNGAKLAVTGVRDPTAIPYPDLAKLTYAQATITVNIRSAIAYVTNKGKFGALRLNSYDFANSALTVNFVTYSR